MSKFTEAEKANADFCKSTLKHARVMDKALELLKRHPIRANYKRTSWYESQLDLWNKDRLTLIKEIEGE